MHLYLLSSLVSNLPILYNYNVLCLALVSQIQLFAFRYQTSQFYSANITTFSSYSRRILFFSKRFIFINAIGSHICHNVLGPGSLWMLLFHTFLIYVVSVLVFRVDDCFLSEFLRSSSYWI